MKLKIKVKLIGDGKMPEIRKEGDWIDLYAAETVKLQAPTANRLNRRKDNENATRWVSIPYTYISLGVAIKLPDGFEAHLLPRSGTPKRNKVFIPTGMGIIDNSYCGNSDEWKFICAPLENTTINKGDRICQFRIVLSQKATFLQKLKWLFSNGIELIQVDSLYSEPRGMNVTGEQ